MRARVRGALSIGIVVAALAALAFACGEDLEVGSNEGQDAGPSTDAPPASADVDASILEPIPGTVCDLETTFEPPAPVPINDMPPISGGGIDETSSPHLTLDEKTIVFMSRRGGRDDFYIADRGSLAEPFGRPAKIPGMHIALGVGSTTELEPFLSGDGLTLYFASNRIDDEAIADFDLYTMTRANRAAPFQAPKKVANPIPTNDNESHPFATDAGLWFGSDRIVPRAIWFSPNLDGALGQPGRMPLGDSLQDSNPTPTFDGRGLYFAREKPDSGTYLDIWLAPRDGPEGAFDASAVRRIDELASEFAEAPGWLSPDNCRLYFARQTLKEQGAALFVATRKPKPKSR